MSVSGISSTNNVSQSAWQSAFSQSQQYFNDLSQALRSGDLAGAQKAFASLLAPNSGQDSTSPPPLKEASLMAGLSIRLSVEADMEHWKRWVADPKVLRWFPFSSEEEIDRAARYVFSFLPQQAVLTAECDGQPCGIAGLVLPEFRKIMHQAVFSIIVAESHRNLGVGTLLLETLLARGKALHGLSLILLEVFEGNPARSLYQRMGFVYYGFQPFYSNMDGQFLGRHLMFKAL
ncbi:MAG: GNAT family N-acetyltransferase [Syntrophobacteraceae bacterium]